SVPSASRREGPAPGRRFPPFERPASGRWNKRRQTFRTSGVGPAAPPGKGPRDSRARLDGPEIDVPGSRPFPRVGPDRRASPPFSPLLFLLPAPHFTTRVSPFLSFHML